MRNHDQKVKDIIESVLPSTHRKGARKERALIHHGERANVRAALRRMRGAEDPDDVIDVDLRFVDRRIGELVAQRRASDKLGPLLRWSERRLAVDAGLRDAPLEERLDYFRRLLPDTTVGRHALGHIGSEVPRRSTRAGRKEAQSNRLASDIDRRRGVVIEILAVGAHGELNRRIRDSVAAVRVRWVRSPSGRVRQEVPRTRRFLLGAHDVDAFAAEAAADEFAAAHALLEDLRQSP